MVRQYPSEVKSVAYLDFPDYEDIVANLPMAPIIANNLDTSTKEGVERLQALIFTRYQDDLISATPKCSCGALTGGYNKGIRCNICYTECVDVLDKPLESTVWIEAPPDIEKFISPGAWIVLSNAFAASKSTFNLLEWLVNPRYPDPKPKSLYYKVCGLLNIDRENRNLNYFYHHFEDIMLRVVTYRILHKKPKNVAGMTDQDVRNAFKQMHEDHRSGAYILTTTPLGGYHRDYIKEREFATFILKYVHQKNRIFTKWLPMPSALGIILETNNSGTWGEADLLVAIDAMYAITQLKLSISADRFGMQNRRAVLCTKKMAEYGEAFIKKTAGSKEGMFRRHICGGRIPFSMRAVISSINAPHTHDELHLPWTPAVQFFRLDIINKLFKRGYGPKQANSLVDSSTRIYNPLIDEIFQELIQEAGGGIWCTWQRSPSLLKGSIQLMRVTRVKTRVTDRTVSWSVNATNMPNADFANRIVVVPSEKMVLAA